MSTTPISGAKNDGDKPKTAAEIAAKAIKKVFDHFAWSVFQTTDGNADVITPKDLGPRAKAVYDGLQARFERAPRIGEHVVVKYTNGSGYASSRRLSASSDQPSAIRSTESSQARSS